MLQPPLRQGQSAFFCWPPTLKINQQALLQSDDGIPLEIALGVVLIASDGVTRKLNPQALQETS